MTTMNWLKINQMLFDYVKKSRKIYDNDDGYLFQEWEKGLVTFTASNNFESHMGNTTATVSIMGRELLYISENTWCGGWVNITVYLFGKKISERENPNLS